MVETALQRALRETAGVYAQPYLRPADFRGVSREMRERVLSRKIEEWAGARAAHKFNAGRLSDKLRALCHFPGPDFDRQSVDVCAAMDTLSHASDALTVRIRAARTVRRWWRANDRRT